MATLKETTTYDMQVIGAEPVVSLYNKELDVHVGASTYRGACLLLTEIVQKHEQPSAMVNPIEYRRNNPGTHWYVRWDMHVVKVIKEVWE